MKAHIVTTRMGGPPWPPLFTYGARWTEEGRPRRAAHTGRYYVGSPAFDHTLRGTLRELSRVNYRAGKPAIAIASSIVSSATGREEMERVLPSILRPASNCQTVQNAPLTPRAYLTNDWRN